MGVMMGRHVDFVLWVILASEDCFQTSNKALQMWNENVFPAKDASVQAKQDTGPWTAQATLPPASPVRKERRFINDTANCVFLLD